ncbi:hypothetical protein BCR32DRAFT_282843 [Anaeromyces robustus]|jgi:hypothetical protein|uniref:Uncharacterized protein n=1 Tax=Anaeromyces robustus TaxID=1754192 RepID=A0A1Y1WW74_9FUNG|nr:hypothetical protein BCR32DRAFT_282843 [Anaeromyces robustus]|eukprot:ORX77811.1 hypothetical protein BCR32DRAFT_282843 [Anaeromyces robustus]
MSKTYVKAKPQQGLKQNNNSNYNSNKKTKNYKSYNKKAMPRKNYNNNNNNNNNNSIPTTKIQKKKEICEMQNHKKMVRFNEIVEVGYTHPADEYDRTSIIASRLTSEDVMDILRLREQFRMETLEATKQRAMEESQQSSPLMSNLMMTSSMTEMNLAVYASTSQGNPSLLTEVPSVTTSIISSPVLTTRTTEEDGITQNQREIEYLIYQKQQLENNYFEALHYQQALQLLAQQQQQQQNIDLWRLYLQQQQQHTYESDIYLQQANSSFYSSILSNNVSPSMALWYSQDNTMTNSDYNAIPLMTEMEVM